MTHKDAFRSPPRPLPPGNVYRIERTGGVACEKKLDCYSLGVPAPRQHLSENAACVGRGTHASLTDKFLEDCAKVGEVPAWTPREVENESRDGTGSTAAPDESKLAEHRRKRAEAFKRIFPQVL